MVNILLIVYIKKTVFQKTLRNFYQKLFRYLNIKHIANVCSLVLESLLTFIMKLKTSLS